MQSSTQRNPEEGSAIGTGAVTATFDDRDAVSTAVRRLSAKSVPADSIRVFVLDRSGARRREIPVEDEAGALRGALIGAGGGALVGLVIVLMVPLGVFGPTNADLFGMRTLTGALRAIAILAVAGLPLGAILGMGHWQGRKKISEEEASSGEIQVVVESESLATLARSVLEDSGAKRVS